MYTIILVHMQKIEESNGSQDYDILKHVPTKTRSILSPLPPDLPERLYSQLDEFVPKVSHATITGQSSYIDQYCMAIDRFVV